MVHNDNHYNTPLLLSDDRGAVFCCWDFGARFWVLCRFGFRFIRENGSRQAAHSNCFD